MTESDSSIRKVLCAREGAELPGLARPPVPGSLGQAIFEKVSEKAWSEWTDQEILVINHYGLNLVNASHQDFLMKKMKAFLLEGAPGVDTSVPPEELPA